jgi:hypothetical protein
MQDASAIKCLARYIEEFCFLFFFRFLERGENPFQICASVIQNSKINISIIKQTIVVSSYKIHYKNSAIYYIYLFNMFLGFYQMVKLILQFIT